MEIDPEFYENEDRKEKTNIVMKKVDTNVDYTVIKKADTMMDAV